MEYALKEIKKSTLQDDKKHNLVLKELEVLTKVDHTNIIHVKEILQDRRHYYIATELMEGGELFERLLKISKFNEGQCSIVIE